MRYRTLGGARGSLFPQAMRVRYRACQSCCSHPMIAKLHLLLHHLNPHLQNHQPPPTQTQVWTLSISMNYSLTFRTWIARTLSHRDCNPARSRSQIQIQTLHALKRPKRTVGRWRTAKGMEGQTWRWMERMRTMVSPASSNALALMQSTSQNSTDNSTHDDTLNTIDDAPPASAAQRDSHTRSIPCQRQRARRVQIGPPGFPFHVR